LGDLEIWGLEDWEIWGLGDLVIGGFGKLGNLEIRKFGD
jgi:hypothetical protein